MKCPYCTLAKCSEVAEIYTRDLCVNGNLSKCYYGVALVVYESRRAIGTKLPEVIIKTLVSSLRRCPYNYQVITSTTGRKTLVFAYGVLHAAPTNSVNQNKQFIM